MEEEFNKWCDSGGDGAGPREAFFAGWAACRVFKSESRSSGERIDVV